MSITCENDTCDQYFEGDCTAASMLRNQADTVGSPNHRKERLTKRGFGSTIQAYQESIANKRCGASDEALRLAIRYARNVYRKMPADPKP